VSDAAPAVPARVPWATPLAAPEPDRLSQLADRILERCRGEGPANCEARCPLHVDARGYVQLTRLGRHREALHLVRERLPFPGILGYICTHPCELHCKRIDQDSAIRIRDIKRFLAEQEPGDPEHILDCEPPRPERAAVIGAGPAGLLAAHDLKRRGYAVTLFEREAAIGGCLTHKIPEWRLPRHVTARDLSIIRDLGIEVRTSFKLGRDVGLESLCREFQAVLLLVGSEGGRELLRREGQALRRTVRDTVRADPVTCETIVPGVFAGGEAVSGPGTVIDALALGRRAAESAHRFLSAEDLREGREGARPAPLLWTLEVDEAERRRRERTPVMLEPFNEALPEPAARTEAERCVDCECALCVKDCEFLSKHTGSPKDIARRVKAGLSDLETRRIVYSCNVCGLCGVVCPERLDTGELIAEARREAVAKGLGPLPGHARASRYWRIGVSGVFRLVMPEPGRRRSKRLFFTGCELAAIDPGNTLRLYAALRHLYPGTGVMMWCCGAPAETLGLETEARQMADSIRQAAEDLGAEELIAACPDCAQVLPRYIPGLRVTTVWEALAGSWHPPARRDGMVVSVQDSCRARHQKGLQAAVRRLVRDAGGLVDELEYREERTRCCGLGGLVQSVDPELSRRIARRRTSESTHSLLTYCAGCRNALAQRDSPGLHLSEFLFSPPVEQAARRRTPGPLMRYANRLRAKWAFQHLKPVGAE